MASESDSLQASSTTGELGTPITSSTSDDSGAATAGSYFHRVGVTRQTAAASVPVQPPSFSISFDIPRHRYPPANATADRTPSQGTPSLTNRDQEEQPLYKPTVARDENGFYCYFDASLPTQWRGLKDGQSKKTPPEHRFGGKYAALPLPPGYNSAKQREDLKKATGLSLIHI